MNQHNTSITKPVKFGTRPISIDDVITISRGGSVELDNDEHFRKRIDSGADFLDKLLQEDGVIYGVTTGYGDSCTVAIPGALIDELPRHLYTFHGCGMGQNLSAEAGLAVIATRLASLCCGYSGVRYILLEQLTCLLANGIAPVIPEEGSVGASGDLTPLSYLAAVLSGEREVYYQGKIRPTHAVFTELGINPLKLRPKEPLAIMNGTAVMTALACLAYGRAEYLSRLTTRITAIAVLALKGNAHHFDQTLFSVKPHPGQGQIAQWLREDLNSHEPSRNSSRLQDRYSLRCAPHVIGVLRDALPWFKQTIETELNSANDNPIIDSEGEHVLHGGHFYGGHIAFVMDAMKNAVANIADLLDRQMALLMDEKFNHGLPPNLSGCKGERAAINHGFKAVQIGASAWTAEALKQTMPASVFSRSTECHNQDKVSMGTISARDCLRVLQLTEQVTAASLLSVTQALALRLREKEIDASTLTPDISHFHQQMSEQFELLTEDRALEGSLRNTVELIQQQQWKLYD